MHKFLIGGGVGRLGICYTFNMYLEALEQMVFCCAACQFHILQVYRMHIGSSNTLVHLP